MPSSFVEYEKVHNRLLRALREGKEFRDIVDGLSAQRTIILAPQNVTLDDVTISRGFVEAHVVNINPHNTFQFASLSGIRGVFSEKRDFVLIYEGPPSDAERFQFFADPSAVFGPGSVFASPPSTPLLKLHILRESHVDVQGVSILLALVSDPVSYHGAPWARNLQPVPKPQVQTRPPDRVVIGENTPSEPSHPLQHVNIHEFLERLKDPRAAEIGKQLKTFIAAFNADEMSSEERAMRARAFLDRMEELVCNNVVWRDGGEAAIAAAPEGLEKYVMSKIHAKAFVPTARDRLLRKRLQALSVLQPQNLEVPVKVPAAAWDLAVAELNRINSFRVPRDKLVCVVNCCKLLLNVLSMATEDAPGADEFLPCLIYVVIRANPQDMAANLEYISNYRSPIRMMGEVGYYFTQLLSAVTFLENCTAEQLNMDPVVFARLVSPDEVQSSVGDAVSHDSAETMSEPGVAEISQSLLAELLVKPPITPSESLFPHTPTDGITKPEKPEQPEKMPVFAPIQLHSDVLELMNDVAVVQPTPAEQSVSTAPPDCVEVVQLAVENGTPPPASSVSTDTPNPSTVSSPTTTTSTTVTTAAAAVVTTVDSAVSTSTEAATTIASAPTFSMSVPPPAVTTATPSATPTHTTPSHTSPRAAPRGVTVMQLVDMGFEEAAASAAIDRLASRGQPFTANDVVALLVDGGSGQPATAVEAPVQAQPQAQPPMPATEDERRYKWLYAQPSDIRLGDIPSLLLEYQRLARAELGSRRR